MMSHFLFHRFAFCSLPFFHHFFFFDLLASDGDVFHRIRIPRSSLMCVRVCCHSPVNCVQHFRMISINSDFARKKNCHCNRFKSFSIQRPPTLKIHTIRPFDALLRLFALGHNACFCIEIDNHRIAFSRISIKQNSRKHFCVICMVQFSRK